MAVRCDHCWERPAAFQVKHPETSLHWRCLHCLRRMALSSDAPFIVFGAATARQTREMTDPVAAGRMADAMEAARDAAKGGAE